MASFLARIHFAIFFLIFLPDLFNAILSVHPPVLFLDEDWPLNRPLDVKICTDRRVEDSLELRILSGNDAEININGIGLPQFGIVALNKSCAGLVLNAHLDVDQNINDQKSHKSQSQPSNSFSLLIENIENKERAALQIEVVDVNDNSPHFLGGPFPLELVIPVDSPSGFLLRRLEVFDPDQGIGGISRFFLHSPNNRSRQLFSLEGQHCEWPKCSVELHLRQPMEEGERAELRVKARDGAGLTQMRANEAEVEIRVLAVAEQKQMGNAKNDGEKMEEEEVTEMGSNPFESDLEKAVRGIVNNRKNGVKANSTIINNLLSTTDQPFTTAPLITFDKKASSFRSSTPQIGTSGSSQNPIEITKNVDNKSNNTKLALNLPSTIPPIPPTNFFIDPLSEDSPIGLELLRIPFGRSKATNGFQFVQFDGSNSLRMLPNGSIQLVNELDAEKWSELRAEIRKSGGQLLATVRANIRPMVEQFEEWMGRIEGEIYLNQSSAELIGPKRILWLPNSLAKYAKLNCPNSDGWKLVGRELLFNNMNVLGRHCCQIEMKYKENKIVAKKICVQIAENIVPIEVHWPANNSRHFFMENVQFPILLTFNSTGPKTMFYAIDQTFHDGPHFLIDPNNGQLSSIEYSHFDYEILNQFSLAILICPNKQNLEENATKCNRICLQLEVLDANDHCPKFETQNGEEKRIIIELSEATKPNLGQPIGQFPGAIDGDGSEGQRSICYRLEENDLGPGGSKIFGIETPEKPELFLLKAVDRELVPNYQLKVLVDDCPWIEQKCPNSESENNSLTIFIEIVDVNDNPPRFSRRHFFAALLRPFQPGEALLQLRAEDPDEIDQHGRLRFGWGEGMVQTDGDPLPIADSPFRMNRSSGELSLREDLSPSSTDEFERISTFTFRVRVKDKAPVHEDQATVTISVLDPVRHLVQLSLGRADAQLESELPYLERLLSALAPERGWLVQVHRMTECGGTNCTELVIYLLDRMFRPIEAKLGMEVLTKAGRERPGQMRELKQKFGLIDIEEAAKIQQKDHHSLRASSPADANSNHSAGGLPQRIRRLFSLSPLAIFTAILMAILALAFPLICCRLICLQLRKFRAYRGPKLLANRSGTFGANGGGTLGRMNPSYGQGGIRLMMVANPSKNGQMNNTEGMPNEFLNENAYIAPKLMDGREAKRLRWQTESEDFEFPAPPPVQMYGSGTLTIPRAKGASNSSMATEF